MSLINLTIPAIIIVSFSFYILSDMLKQKIIINNLKTVVCFIFSVVSIAIVFSIFSSFIKALFDCLIIMLACKIIYKETISKSLSSSFFVIIYYFIAEIIFCLILALFLKVDAVKLQENWVGSAWSNLLISVIALGISDIGIVKEFSRKVISNFEKAKYSEILILVILMTGILSDKNAYFLDIYDISYIVNLFLIALFVCILFYLLREKNNSNQLSQRYDHLFGYIQKYEKELNAKNMLIHEYRNQIIALQGFIPKSNKKATNYIDSIIEDFSSLKSETLKGMENLPKGGLKGLIYYKLGDSNDDGLHVSTNISNNVKNANLSKMEISFYKDFIKLVGIYLDNAIEAAKNSSKKNVLLEIYLNNNKLYFVLSNTYAGKVDIEKFYTIGFSTKGKGRGYGLSLAKQILEKRSSIVKEERAITNEYYTVTVIIELKNIPIYD